MFFVYRARRIARSLEREADQFARFLELVANHKHSIGFTGADDIRPTL